MKRPILKFTLIFSLSAMILGCGSSGSNSENSDSIQQVGENNVSNSEPVVNETEIKNFLYSPEGTYGWKSTKEEFLYDFFKDGRLSIQGADGEATMWEGKWSLSGNMITLENTSKNSVDKVTVKIDGENLVLGDVVFKRYKP